VKSSVVLEVEGLKTYFYTEEGVGKAVDDVSFSLDSGEILGIVGESGCGKSVTSLSIMRLIPQPPGRIEGGRILFKGDDLLDLPESKMRKVRGNSISMIFQEPMTSLNPVFTVGRQIAESLEVHTHLSKKEIRARCVELLTLVGIPSPERRLDEYPHQFSGGMRQRVMIAIALACDPEIVIADEPTTALDVTIQAQILDLMRRLCSELNMSILLITHDLAVIAEMAQRVIVMYAGKVVEEASVTSLFKDPKHPYTQGLLRSIPRLDHDAEELESIEGLVPSPFNRPEGCGFKNRCPRRFESCDVTPALKAVNDSRVACWLYEKEGS